MIIIINKINKIKGKTISNTHITKMELIKLKKKKTLFLFLFFLNFYKLINGDMMDNISY